MIEIFHAVAEAGIIDAYRGSLIKAPGPVNLLLSYPYVPSQIRELRRLKAEGKVGKLFMDSNTYSLNPDGIWSGINRFEEYINAVRRFGHEFDHLASYDINFRDPEMNWHYHLVLLDLFKGTGLDTRIMPVIHSVDDASR